MKALTLIQPWATLIMLQEKKIETRSWQTKYRGTLIIHAGKKVDKEALENPFYKELLANYGITSDNIITSAMLGTVNLVDIKPTSELRSLISTKEKELGTYSDNRFGWMLEQIKEFESPIPYKGSLGLWEVDIQSFLSKNKN